MLQCGTGGIEEADRISRWRLAAVSSAGFARRVANGVLMASLVLYTDGLINSQVVTSVRRFNGSLPDSSIVDCRSLSSSFSPYHVAFGTMANGPRLCFLYTSLL